MTRLLIHAPISGWAAPLEEVPDPVFAGRMMGDGVAVDPTEGRLVAPCAGVVVKAHPAGHAVTLRTAEGAEILMHVGVDTVALGGRGFELHVRDGEAVVPGQPLTTFDLDALSQQAPSLITPVLVVNADRFRVSVLRSGCEVAAGEPLIALEALAAADAGEGAGPAVRRTLRVTHAHGLHARPAALLAAEARRWTAAVEVSARGQAANARSPVAVMALGVQGGDEVELAASGADAEAALEALARTVAQINAAPEPAPAAAPAATASPAAAGSGQIQGVPAAPGLAAGPAWRLKLAEAPVSEAARDAAHELAALDAALAQVRAQMTAGLARLAGDARAVVEAHLGLLDDPGLAEAARAGIAEGASAGAAWRDATLGYVRMLEGLGDARLAERALDLKDIEQQVLWALSGETPAPPAPPPGAILLTEDLMPSELAGLEGAALGGVCLARGGPTSHVAVLAAAMDIPCVVAAGPGILVVADGRPVVVDGALGVLEPAPDAARLAAVEAETAARRRRAAEARAAAGAPAETVDGVRIEVLANVGSAADARLAAANGADGCGLLRTEFLFLERATPPDEAEQLAAYQAVAEALAGRPVTVRTLDVGGDKPAAYLDLPAEENPALGLRGVRVSLSRPELFRAQLRAILRVRPAGQCKIMAPMVASLDEIQDVRRLLAEVAAAEGLPLPALGVMVETPAAAATADLIAPHVDFLSLGTNDLAQYALAMDRGNPALAAGVDALHPAVLRLVRMTAEAGAQAGKPVSVCGGLASDPAAAPILIGLGVRQLSVAPARAAEIKALVRTLDAGRCRELAQAACEQTSAAAVRALKPPAARPPRSRKGAAA